VGLDHVVVTTPDFDRSSAALAEAGLELRRVREAPGGVRQGFRRLGPAILELVAAPGASDPTAPARFWGLVVIVSDLDALAARLGAIDRLSTELREAEVRGDATERGISLVYVSPLKALSYDIDRNLRVPLRGLGTDLRVAVRTGDTPQRERRAMLKEPPDI